MADDPEQELLRIDDRPTDVITNVADAAATIIGNLGPIGIVGEVVTNLFTGGTIKKKLQTLAWEVSSEINRLDFRVGRLAADMQEYVFRLMQEAVPVADQEKLGQLRNAMLNVVVGNGERAWMPVLLECVRSLGVDELQLLKVYYYGAHRKNPAPDPRTIGGTPNSPNAEDILALGFPEQLVDMMVGRLERLGLLTIVNNEMDTLLGGAVTGAHLRNTDVTDLGWRFFKLINCPQTVAQELAR